jgi:hypothetical protein
VVAGHRIEPLLLATQPHINPTTPAAATNDRRPHVQTRMNTDDG